MLSTLQLQTLQCSIQLRLTHKQWMVKYVHAKNKCGQNVQTAKISSNNSQTPQQSVNKKLSYRRGTMQRAISVEIIVRPETSG